MKNVKAIALDVDGVLTDGGVWWGPDGQEWKRFCFADIMGVSLARRAGLIVALISGEDSPLVDRFASKLGIVDVVKNCKDKAQALETMAAAWGLPLSQVAFMGDDVNDLGAMQLAGLCAVPPGAIDRVKASAAFVTKRCGGDGAVREFIEAILAAQSATKRAVS